MSSAQDQLMTKPGAKFYLFYGDETSTEHIYAELEYYREHRKPKKVSILNFASVNDSSLYDAYIVESAGIKYLVMSEDIQDNAILDKENERILRNSITPSVEKESAQDSPVEHDTHEKHGEMARTNEDRGTPVQESPSSRPYISLQDIDYGTTRITVRSRYDTEQEAYTEVLRAMKRCGIFPGNTNDSYYFLSSEWKAAGQSRVNYKINISIYREDGYVFIDFSGKYSERSATVISLLIFGFKTYDNGMRQATYSRDALSQNIFSDIMAIINRLDIFNYQTI